MWCRLLPDLQDKPRQLSFVPPQSGLRRLPLVPSRLPGEEPTPYARVGPTGHWESSRASRGKPLAHSHGTSASPTTGDLTIPSRALDRRGIRRSGVSPADSLNGYRELLSIHGCATVAGASWFNCRLAAITMHLPASHNNSLTSSACVS